MSHIDDEMAVVRALDGSPDMGDGPPSQYADRDDNGSVDDSPDPASDASIIGRHALAGNFEGKLFWCFGKVIAKTEPDADEPDGQVYYKVLSDDKDR